jgi:hypothetical protein
MYEAFCGCCYASFQLTEDELEYPVFSAPRAICPHCGAMCTELVDDYEKPGVGMVEYDEETDLETESDPESDTDEGEGASEGDVDG